MEEEKENLEMSNWAAAMEEDLTNTIIKVKERQSIDNESSERRMISKWRKRFEEEKAKTRAAVEKQYLLFEKE